jgi:membrane protein implicated in regulation of membrane protease activity
MENQGEKSNGLPGIAALFNDVERKEIFRKYLYFLGWVEVLLLLTCWLYQIGDSGHEGTETTFPWRLYFIIAFLAPVGITFLVGTIIVGFNRYFAEPEPVRRPAAEEMNSSFAGGNAGRIEQLNQLVKLVRRLPFLGLLLLIGLAVGFLYKLDVIMGTIGNIGEKSVRILLISAGIILILVSIFALILVLLNYQLRKKAMEYQYKSQVAEQFGLIILADNTVLNSKGRLLVSGRKWKNVVQQLPEPPGEDKPSENAGPELLPGPVDPEK